LDLRFVEALQKALKNELPGEEAQYLMAPVSRKELVKESRVENALVLLYNKNKIPHFVLIKRQVYQGVHSNQISFPGGKAEKQDSNSKETALRETHEEIGIAPTKIELIGELTSLYIPPSGFLVYPHVGITHDNPQFDLEKKEVQSIIEIPIKELFKQENRIQKKITVGSGIKIKTPCFDFDGHIVWGATAMILSEFSQLI